MITILLALLGCFFIVLSIVYFYKGNNLIKGKSSEAEIELAKAKKEIEKLNSLLNGKDTMKNGAVLSSNSVSSYQTMLGNNLPLIEITDLDLSDENNGKKSDKNTYIHQLRFYVFNVGKNSLKDVIISIKDIYNDPKDIKKRSRTIGHHDDEGIDSDKQGIGTYENFEINTLNLKSRRLVYASTLPSSFGVAEYTFNVVVEWKGGFYQMEIRIEEFDGKLKYHYQYFDVNGNPINFENLENGIKK
jgi:hypothetical protein